MQNNLSKFKYKVKDQNNLLSCDGLDKQIVNNLGVLTQEEEKEDYFARPGLENEVFNLSFNSMRNDPTLHKTSKANDSFSPRIVRKGLNIEATCNNPSCRGFDQPKHRVWVPLGYGIFDLGFTSCNTKCRICQQPVTDADNIGFKNAKIVISGRRVGEKINVEKEYVHDEPHSLKKFEQTNGTCQWIYLKLTVSPVIGCSP